MNKRTMKKMAKAKQQAAEAAKTAETVVKTAAPAKEVKPTTEKTLHTEAAEGKAEPKKATKKETVKKTIKKETTETMAEATKTPRKMTKVSDTVLEIFETKVSMKDLEAVIKKEVKANGLKGEIKIYLNAEQRAAYYTVDGQGSDDFKVDLTTLAE